MSHLTHHIHFLSKDILYDLLLCIFYLQYHKHIYVQIIARATKLYIPERSILIQTFH